MGDMVRIRDICDVFDGPHATPKRVETGPVYLGIKALNKDGTLNPSEYTFLSETDFVKWTKRVTPKAGDIVFSYEATLGRYALIPERFYGCLGRRLAVIRTKSDSVNIKWLYYYLRSPEWTAFISNQRISGSTVDRISIGEFPNYQINLPSRLEQDQIAEILGNIDEKINTSNQAIALLQRIANTIYDYWFVQFNFPNEEGKPYRASGGKMVYNKTLKRKIPDRWAVGKLADICSYSTEKVSSTSLTGENYASTNNLLQAKQGLVAATSVPTNQNITGYSIGDTLVSNIRPYLKKIAYCYSAGGCSTDVLCFKPTTQAMSAYLYFTLFKDSFFNYVSAGSKGTRMPRGDKCQIMDFPLPIPSVDYTLQFSEIANQILLSIGLLKKENGKLSELRDWLLPMLMNGQVSISTLTESDGAR
jgi:type I restriction enzyme S subunit